MGASLNVGESAGPVGPIYLLKTEKGEVPEVSKEKVVFGGETYMEWPCGCKTSYSYDSCRLGHTTGGSYHWVERLDKSCGEVHSRAYDSSWEEVNNG